MTCIVCNSDAIELVVEVPEPNLTSSMKHVVQPFDLVICKSCGHIQNQFKQQVDLKKYYSEEYDLFTQAEEEDVLTFSPSGTGVPNAELSFSLFAKDIKSLKAGKYLDVGCGKGAMLRYFTEEFPQWQAYGFDVSEIYRPFLQKILPQKNVLIGDPGILSQFEESFDLVSAFEVLEHVESPTDFIRNAYNMLKPNGYLYLQIPDIEKAELDWLIADHLSHFNKGILEQTLQSLGFNVVLVTNEQAFASIQILAQKTPEITCGAKDVVAENKRIMSGHLAYYGELETMVQKATQQTKLIAVFGTGTAATVIGLLLRKMGTDVTCFIDENPHRIGTQHLGVPVVAIEDIPRDTETVLLGVTRPNVAKVMPKLNAKQYQILAVSR